MNILKIFAKKTNYPPQVIPPKALEVIESVDSKLFAATIKNDCDLTIVERQISLKDQFKPVDKIVNELTRDLTGYYLPRSVAFYINADGTWVFLIGIRSTILNTINTGMWIHILTQTNNARNQQ